MVVLFKCGLLWCFSILCFVVALWFALMVSLIVTLIVLLVVFWVIDVVFVVIFRFGWFDSGCLVWSLLFVFVLRMACSLRVVCC